MRSNTFRIIVLCYLLLFSMFVSTAVHSQDWVWVPWETDSIKDTNGGVEAQMEEAAGTGFDCWSLPGGECDLSSQTDSILGVDGNTFCRRIDVVLTSGTYKKISCSNDTTLCSLHESSTARELGRVCCDKNDLANTSMPDVCWSSHDTDCKKEVYDWYGIHLRTEDICPND